MYVSLITWIYICITSTAYSCNVWCMIEYTPQGAHDQEPQTLMLIQAALVETDVHAAHHTLHRTHQSPSVPQWLMDNRAIWSRMSRFPSQSEAELFSLEWANQTIWEQAKEEALCWGRKWVIAVARLNIALVVLAGGGVGPVVVTNIINGCSAGGGRMGVHAGTGLAVCVCVCVCVRVCINKATFLWELLEEMLLIVADISTCLCSAGLAVLSALCFTQSPYMVLMEWERAVGTKQGIQQTEAYDTVCLGALHVGRLTHCALQTCSSVRCLSCMLGRLLTIGGEEEEGHSQVRLKQDNNIIISRKHRHITRRQHVSQAYVTDTITWGTVGWLPQLVMATSQTFSEHKTIQVSDMFSMWQYDANSDIWLHGDSKHAISFNQWWQTHSSC